MLPASLVLYYLLQSPLYVIVIVIVRSAAREL